MLKLEDTEMKTFDQSSQIHHMSYSTGLNLNSPSEFTFENLREKPIITDPNKQVRHLTSVWQTGYGTKQKAVQENK